MLDANNDNSIATTKSSSIKLSILDEIPIFFLKYKLMIINIYNASKKQSMGTKLVQHTSINNQRENINKDLRYMPS
jgi:hypothetical protein